MELDFGSDILGILVNIIIIGGMVIGAIAFFGRTVMKRFTSSPEIKSLMDSQDEIKATQATNEKLDAERFNSLKLVQDAQSKTLDNVVARTQQIEDRTVETIKNQAIALASQQDMLTGLQKRSDLVNGNIASIRTDVADLSDDLDELYAMIEDRNANPPDSKSAIRNAELRTYSRTRKRSMKEKRRRIEADRIDQSESECQQ